MQPVTLHSVTLLGLDALQEAELLGVGRLDGGILVSRQLLVVSLELLDVLLEGLLKVRDGLVGVVNNRLALTRRHGVVLGKDGLLVIIAQVDVVVGAGRAEGFVSKLLQRVVCAAALVRVALRVAREGLDGRVPTDAELGAEILLDGAVNVADQDGLGAGKVVAELVPVGLHRFAVASPRGLELNKGSLACGKAAWSTTG